MIALADELVKEVADLEPLKWCGSHNMLYSRLYREAQRETGENNKRFNYAMLNLVENGLVELTANVDGELLYSEVLPN